MMSGLLHSCVCSLHEEIDEPSELQQKEQFLSELRTLVLSVLCAA